MFLAWFDDNAKHSVQERIAAGARAYTERFGAAPRVVLMSDTEETQRIVLDSMIVLFKSYIRPNIYWFGQTDA